MRSLNRLCIQAKLASDLIVPISKDDFHYIKNVLRAKEIRVFNDVDGEFRAVINDSAKRPELTISEKLRDAYKGSYKGLAFGIIRSNRLSWLLEKATELGVTDFYPLLCKHSQTHDFKHDRYERIIKEASEQCERFDMPILHAPQKLEEFINKCDRKWCYGAIGSDNNLLDKNIEGVIIGPEGGFSHDEELFLKQNCVGLNMGPYILRAETAAIYGLSKIELGLHP